MRKSSWKKNKLRIFVTAEAQDNSKQMESALKVYLSQFRVFFVSMELNCDLIIVHLNCDFAGQV